MRHRLQLPTTAGSRFAGAKPNGARPRCMPDSETASADKDKPLKMVLAVRFPR